MRPLSDPGATGRVAPFASVAVIALISLLFTTASADRFVLATAAVLTTIMISAALLLPWARLPAWSEAAIPLAFFVLVALLRHAGGGWASAYTPLVILPILWMAIHGSRTQLRLAIAGIAPTFVVPVVLVGPPTYPALGWLEAVTWMSIGLLAGSAIQKLVEQSRHRTADVAALGVITRALTAGSDPRAELCAAAQMVTGAAFVVMYEPHVDGALVATAGTEGVDLAGMRTTMTAEFSATATAWRSGRRVYLADGQSRSPSPAPQAGSQAGPQTEHNGAGAVLYQPVTRDGRRMAVVVLGFEGSRRNLSATDIYLVELLAAEIGAAIDRADLVSALAAESHTDALTGATNRRGWDEEVDRQLSRARRTGDPFTVAIIDMDHFKAYNDAHGHVAGDALLKELVVAIRRELRTGDVIARWGGEEFALALPDCDLKQAQTIAARLLKVVPSGQTASIGFTQALDRDTARALIERADRALYTAKTGGRNQIRGYEGSPPLGLVKGAG